MEEKLYRVAWRVRANGYSGHGKPMAKEEAEAWAERANKRNRHIYHWVEQVPEDEAVA